MRNPKIKIIQKSVLIISVFSFWIGVWAIASYFVSDSYILPSPLDTVKALFTLISEPYFFKVVGSSILRVLLGLIIGFAIGILLGRISHVSNILKSFISPIITVIKAIPVAAIIIILWVTLVGSKLTVFIGVMMVVPIIYQNTLEGLDSVNKNLLEISDIFELTFIKRLRLLILPSLFSYIFPALITSVGLAFKSQIAAEIIAYTNNSIGQYIYDAKFNFMTSEVFAWTIIIVAFSILIEALTRLLRRRLKNVSGN